MSQVTYGKCQQCNETITDHHDYYHCDKCDVTKCSGCVKVTIDPETNEMVCSEQIDSETLCGGFLGYMYPNIRLEDNEMIFDNKTWKDIRKEEERNG